MNLRFTQSSICQKIKVQNTILFLYSNIIRKKKNKKKTCLLFVHYSTLCVLLCLNTKCYWITVLVLEHNLYPNCDGDSLLPDHPVVAVDFPLQLELL